MKNIRILQTDKPSRLAYDFDKLILNSRLLSPILYKTQHIYITSDEEINQQTKPCWCINTIKNTWDADLIYYQGSMPQYHYVGFKKIILTTDPSLDGVQAIDDEFLEWFVKNPSCEEIEVRSNYRVKSGTIQEHKEGKAGYEYYDYKIIIPKEEPKQHVELINDNIEEFDKAIELFKQETIKEAAKKYPLINQRIGFIEGAKWQMERSYSEDEVKEIAFNFYYDMSHKMGVLENLISENATNVDKWFKQYERKNSK